MIAYYAMHKASYLKWVNMADSFHIVGVIYAISGGRIRSQLNHGFITSYEGSHIHGDEFEPWTVLDVDIVDRR